jgi:hypothetical protein
MAAGKSAETVIDKYATNIISREATKLFFDQAAGTSQDAILEDKKSEMSGSQNNTEKKAPSDTGTKVDF